MRENSGKQRPYILNGKDSFQTLSYPYFLVRFRANRKRHGSRPVCIGLLCKSDSSAGRTRTPLPVGLELLCRSDMDSSAGQTRTPLQVGLGLLCQSDSDSSASQTRLLFQSGYSAGWTNLLVGLICRSDQDSSASWTWTPLPVGLGTPLPVGLLCKSDSFVSRTPLPVGLGLLCRSDWDSSAGQTRTPLPVGLGLLFQSGYSAGWTPLPDGLLYQTQQVLKVISDLSFSRLPYFHQDGHPYYCNIIGFDADLANQTIAGRTLPVGLCQLDFTGRTQLVGLLPVGFFRSDFCGLDFAGRNFASQTLEIRTFVSQTLGGWTFAGWTLPL